MAIPVTILKEPGWWSIKTPYNASFVAEIKARIPSSKRRWVPDGKIWKIADGCESTLVSLLAIFGFVFDPAAYADAKPADQTAPPKRDPSQPDYTQKTKGGARKGRVSGKAKTPETAETPEEKTEAPQSKPEQPSEESNYTCANLDSLYAARAAKSDKFRKEFAYLSHLWKEVHSAEHARFREERAKAEAEERRRQNEAWKRAQEQARREREEEQRRNQRKYEEYFGGFGTASSGGNGTVFTAFSGHPKTKSEAARTLWVAENAPVEVIKASQKAMARLVHPDLGGSTEKMQAVNVAADILLAGR